MAFLEQMMDEVDRSWMKDALCRGLSADLFHPMKGDYQTGEQARKICNGDQRSVKDFVTQKWHLVGPPPCPVKDQCLNYIMSLPQSQDGCGVYGGLSHKQRLKLRAKQDEATKVRMRPRCGTVAGYAGHLRAKQEPCEACRVANNEDKRRRSAEKRALAKQSPQD
jgi:hypothetical protein